MSRPITTVSIGRVFCMRLHAFYHVPFEDVGSIKPWAAAKGYAIGTTSFFADEAPPPVSDYDMLVVMGGPMGVYDEKDHPWLAGEKKAIEAAVGAGKPVLGICLGAQLLSVALGGTVTRNPVPEIGWFKVDMTPEGLAEPVFAGFPPSYYAFHWHGDTFSLPPGAVHAAGSAACANQAFVYGHKVVGLQFHLETQPIGMQNLIKHCAADVALPGPTVQHPKQMHAGREAFKDIAALMARVCDALTA
ncbi:type 1 glutamine amidotransferase [Solidesulfovibrio sp.]|uniref:type 1 glutamine amidotransferase n=1 Tax=Solidesulfovibrio sp. TaxID=2910990 RepID=UPI002B202336|nr:type 1 glutamine amidotransferase [Solidesulfovibrio sp.]MEA4855706.1 type 1 glutamine amidotransferase [Solidesulfovibrio sp.]